MTTTTPARRIRRWPVIAAVGATVAGGIVLSNPSLAFWSATAETESIVLTAGTAEVSLVGPTAPDGELLWPGRTITYEPGTVENTGDVPLEISIAHDGSTLAGTEVIVRVGLADGAGACSPTLHVLDVAIPIGTVAAGAETALCVTVEMPLSSAAAPDASAPITLSLHGVQR